MSRDEITMIDKVKISKSKLEIVWLALLLGIFFVIMLIIGGIQYILCLDKNPDTTIAECFRFRGPIE